MLTTRELPQSPPAQKAEFIISAAAAHQFPQTDLPEIALLGRSNAGKSSLLNKFLGRKALARVGATPGRTRMVNFFEITWAPGYNPFLLADLPGYGYAAAPKYMVDSWRKLVETYLSGNTKLKLALLLMDLRRDPGPDEEQLLSWLAELGHPAMLIGTKADKLSGNQLTKRVTAIKKSLGVKPWPFSAVTGQGRDGLIKIIGDTLNWQPPTP